MRVNIPWVWNLPAIQTHPGRAISTQHMVGCRGGCGRTKGSRFPGSLFVFPEAVTQISARACTAANNNNAVSRGDKGQQASLFHLLISEQLKLVHPSP